MTSEIQVIEQNEITVAFNNPQGIQSIIDNIKSQVNEQFNGIVWDFTKEKDRKAVASMAYKVGRSKTAIDAEGKKLKEQYTVFTKAIDADRKLAREQLEAEQERIRKPLDDWESAEKCRVEALQLRVDEISLPCEFESSHFIKSHIEYIKSIEVDDSFMEFKDKAKLAKFEKLETLNNLLTSVEKKEEEDAELEKQRIKEQQRIQQERDAQIALEAAKVAENLAKEKARLIAERVAHEKAEAEQREANLKYEAEQALIREQRLKEQAEQQARQAEIDKALAIERAEQAAKQAEHNKQLAIQDERERIERETRAKEEAEKIAEQARLDNVEHMRSVNQAILKQLALHGIDEVLGQNLIKAIYKKEIPNISIQY